MNLECTILRERVPMTMAPSISHEEEGFEFDALTT